jgi:hypothetical protein
MRKKAPVGAGAQRWSSPHRPAHTTVPDPSSIENYGDSAPFSTKCTVTVILPPPPYGCVWVWLNGDVALIDRSDGYILDIARNVW